MGGVGNQFFQICRALSLKSLGNNVELLRLNYFKKLILKIIGQPIQSDWIDIEKLAIHCNLKIRSINFIEFCSLIFLFLLKKINFNFFFDLDLSRKQYSKLSLDIGYFQDSYHLSLKAIQIFLIKLETFLPKRLKALSKKELILHIRGNDFLENKNNLKFNRKPLLDEIIKVSNIFLQKKFSLRIVSDDEYYIENLKLLDGSINFDNSSAFNDFLALVRSKYLFVSPSTYCFWASLLAYKVNKCEIINPKGWIFANLYEEITKNFANEDFVL